MSWTGDLGDVAANRAAAFPPLHAEHDNGNWDTQFIITVPYLINGERYLELLESLKRWAEDQGLTDFLTEDDGGLSYVAMPRTKIKEDPDGETE